MLIKNTVTVYLKFKSELLRLMLADLIMHNEQISVAKWSGKTVYNWFHFRGTLIEVLEVLRCQNEFSKGSVGLNHYSGIRCSDGTAVTITAKR